MSLALKQLLVLVVTFLFLLIQLGLRRASTKTREPPVKIRVVEEAIAKRAQHHLNNHEQQHESLHYYHRKPIQIKVIQHKVENHWDSLLSQTQEHSQTRAMSGLDVATEYRMTSNRARYIKVCKSLPKQERTRTINYSNYAFGRLQWCSIPKSGSTFLSRELRPTLRKKDGDDISISKRFMIVREPYSRLVSAFFSKIVGHPGWWFGFGTKIISKFRSSSSSNSLRCGHDVSFAEFIKFFIYSYENSWMKNSHFQPIHSVCDLCDDPPDFIVKLETIKPDMQFVLDSVNVSGDTGKPFIEIRHLAELFMSFKPKFQGCDSMCTLLNRFWWGQQATGLISNELPLPVKGQACDEVTGKQLADMAWNAHINSVFKIGDKLRYKQNVSIELWRQVSLGDRIRVRDAFSFDCRLFGYDCSPYFVFPKK